MMRKLLSMIFSRHVLIIIGVAALLLAIWYAGPLFAFAHWRPLETVESRLWCIAMVLGLFVLRLLLGLWRRRQLNGRLLEAVLSLRNRDREGRDAGGAGGELAENFGRALERLKRAGMSTGNEGWWGRLRHRYVYQLPWYVVIGAPGAGKTTALVNSGLSFPLAEELGQERIKGAGGTRNCDWWFTDQAVLLDTAGRYTTQDSDAAGDKAEWLGFLGLLKKYRPRQPLNGAILSISLQTLLGGDESERKRHAARLRARLDELQGTLGIGLPVYVLITKSDLLGGFNEYFAALDKRECAQVWGFTLPYVVDGTRLEKSDATRIRHELDLLSRRLFERLPDVLLEEHDLSRRARAYALPQHFARLAPLIDEMLGHVFGDGRHLGSVILRGVYFTSGTQEGTPFDRVLSALGRSLGMDAQIGLQGVRNTGKSYFLADLLCKVVFAEAHLAGRNQRAERRERLLSVAGHGAVVAALAVVVLGWSVSFRNNATYIELVGTKAERLGATAGELASADLLSLMPLLSNVQNLAQGEGFTVPSPPLDHTYGLYQGFKLQAAAETKYRKALEGALLPQIVKRLEFQLRNVPANDPELGHEVLKAYLMLHDAERYDGEALETFMRLDWERSLPLSVSKAQRDELFAHLHALLQQGVVTSPFPPDQALIAARREMLAAHPPAQRLYARLKRRLSDGAMVDFNVADAGGPQAALVFARASGKPLNQGIPGLFTHRGYHEVFLPESRSLLSMMEGEERWVVGEPPRSVREQASRVLGGTLEHDVLRLYLHEYVRVWDEYLSDLRLRENSTMTQSIEAARILSAPDSPIAQFLRAVARETTLLRPSEEQNASMVGRAASKVRTATRDLERVFGPSDVLRQDADGVRLERIVDDRFEPIRRLVTGSGGSAPIDASLRLFNDLYMSLSTADVALRTGALSMAQSDVLMRVRAEAARLPMPLRPLLEGLADTGGAQAAGSMRRSLGSTLESSLGDFCRTATYNRYPFLRTAAQDVTLADFARLFAPGGMFDQFFNERLAAMTDVSGPVWMLRQSDAPALALRSFQQAARIRDVFFPSGGRTPETSFGIRVLEMDADITHLALDVDGQLVRYAHGPQVSQNVAWPGPKGASHVRLELAGPGGSRYMVKTGPWALMRFFDEGSGRTRVGAERFSFAVAIEGKRVVLEVTANSVLNPFDFQELSAFACPSKI